MDVTPMQEQIEREVTFGIGYTKNSSFGLRRSFEKRESGIYGDLGIDLQMHLGVMDATCADSKRERDLILEKVNALGKIKDEFSRYCRVGELNDFEDVYSALQTYSIFMRLGPVIRTKDLSFCFEGIGCECFGFRDRREGLL
jgi:hypothetical protein